MFTIISMDQYIFVCDVTAMLVLLELGWIPELFMSKMWFEFHVSKVHRVSYFPVRNMCTTMFNLEYVIMKR